ncbi:hypothetical protein MKW92_042908 [Papaver armeniacum]|nr:hypothetical protein MKW92_042908 [Papaver armeniacum]
MSEPEEEENQTTFIPKLSTDKSSVDKDSLMDLDLDFDSSSWPFDQTSFCPRPSSPFFLSIFSSTSSPNQNQNQQQQQLPLVNVPSLEQQQQQPSSPLWVFSDGDDDKFGSALNGFSSLATSGASIRISDYPKLISRIPESMTLRTEDEKSQDLSCVIKERITQALRYFKESTEQTVLAQVWAPIKNGDRHVLQLLFLSCICFLWMKRIAVTWVFWPCFRQKLPEWTPNVQYYSKEQYPRLIHALNYNSCVAVIELILTSQKVNYALRLIKSVKLLRLAVNLKSSDILDNPNLQLPLAQTWVPCRHRSVLADGGGVKKSCSSFDGSCGQGKSACRQLIDACAEHHLQKGQGWLEELLHPIVHVSLRDITQFSKTEYPLDLLSSIMTSMKEHFRSLRVATEHDLTTGLSKRKLMAPYDGLSNGENRTGVDGSNASVSTHDFCSMPNHDESICRQHGISRWPSRKINKVNRSLSKLRRTFNLTSLSTEVLLFSVAVGSISWPTSKGERESVTNTNDQSTFRGETGTEVYCYLIKEINHEQKMDPIQSSVRAQMGQKSKSGSADGSTGNPASHGSSQSSPAIHFNQEQGVNIGNSLNVVFPQNGELNLTALLRWRVVLDDQVPNSSWINPPVLDQTTYQRNGSSIGPMPHITLAGLAKRLKLEMGTFEIKYLDDDQEWVVLACDADLQECLKISRSSGKHMIRLLVHDMIANLGSSCESSGE